MKKSIAFSLMLAFVLSGIPQSSEAVWWWVGSAVKKVVGSDDKRDRKDQRNNKDNDEYDNKDDGYNPYHNHPDGRRSPYYNEKSNNKW